MTTGLPRARGDVVRGEADSDAVAFADAARHGSRAGKVWLLWSPRQVVLVAISGKGQPQLTRLWSGEDQSKPFIDTETGEMSWPDGSALQLDLSDEKREKDLFRQQTM